MTQRNFGFPGRTMTMRDRAFLEKHRRLKAEDDATAAIDQAGGYGYADKQLVEIAVKLIRESESGSALLIDDGKSQAWVPKSQVKWNGQGVMSLPEWLAKKKGFI